MAFFLKKLLFMLLDGQKIATEIQRELKHEIDSLPKRKPCLAVILVGEHPASLIYVNRKIAACEQIGIRSVMRRLPNNISEKQLLQELEKLNVDSNVDGILVQLPLPDQINPLTIIANIAPEKDVDGLHPVNAGRLLIGDDKGFVPCTPLGIKILLQRYGINLQGKRVVILGRSNLVGKPLAALLMQNAPGANATVTIAHSQTKNIKQLCLEAEILIAAIGKPQFVTADMVNKEAVVIDVGINKIASDKNKKGTQIVGDVDFESVRGKCQAITPVPGGIGPMTIAMLLSNTLKAFRKSILQI